MEIGSWARVFHAIALLHGKGSGLRRTPGRSQVGWQGVKVTYAQETLARYPFFPAGDLAGPAGGR